MSSPEPGRDRGDDAHVRSPTDREADGGASAARDQTTRPRWWLTALVVAMIVVVAVVAVVVRARGEVEQYWLNPHTMVPTELSVRAGDVSCPAGASPTSPIEFSEVSGTSPVLPLYDGDLIVVRINLFPPTPPPGNEISFAASWPASVVGLGGPVCVFVVGDNTSGTAVNWRAAGTGSTEFVVVDPVPDQTNQIEVWLQADDPEPGASFATLIVPEQISDSIVIDPLGGRATVQRRRGAAAEVTVEAEPADNNSFSVVATVSNPLPRTLTLASALTLTSSGPGEWSPSGETASRFDCATGQTLQCRIGTLEPGESVEVTATMQHPPGWAPAPVTCDRPNGASGFGFCVLASATAEVGSARVERIASSLVELPMPQNEQIAIRTDPDPVIWHAGEVVEFAFTLTSTGPGDLASVEITGSDCFELERVVQPLDDGDAFLEVGESWRFTCHLDLSDSPTYRLDVAARTSEGEIVTASYSGIVQEIEPALTLTTVRLEGDAALRVANSGDGLLYDVAVVVPGCTSLTIIDGQPSVIAEGEFIQYACSDGEPDTAGTVAYATDEVGQRIASTLADGR